MFTLDTQQILCLKLQKLNWSHIESKERELLVLEFFRIKHFKMSYKTRASMLHFRNFLVDQSTPAYSDETHLAQHSVLSISPHENFLMCSRVLNLLGATQPVTDRWSILPNCFIDLELSLKMESTLQFKRKPLPVSLYYSSECQNHTIINSLPKIIYLLIIKILKFSFNKQRQTRF